MMPGHSATSPAGNVGNGGNAGNVGNGGNGGIYYLIIPIQLITFTF